MKRESYELIIGLLLAAFLPNIFFFFLYNNNRVMGEIAFIHSAILAAIFSIISICFLLLFRVITRGTEKALCILIVSWIPFWLFETIYSFTSSIITLLSRRVLLMGHAIVIVALLLILRKYSPLQKYNQIIFRILTGVILVLFLLNFTPALYTEISASRRESSGYVYDVKVNFTVDEQLPSPDIYWLHMDGMMSFDTIYKYFGDSQDELKAELEQRGFIINENAELIAGYTQVAVPALLSPAFYDSYLGVHLSDVAHLLRYDRKNELNKIFASDGLHINRDITPHSELFKAFMAKGYNTVLISSVSYRNYPSDYFYRVDKDDFPLMLKGTHEVSATLIGIENIVQLLLSTTSLRVTSGTVSSLFESMKNETWLPIPEYKDEIESLTLHTRGLTTEKSRYRRLLDTYTVESPKFTFITNTIAHLQAQVINVNTEIVDISQDDLNEVGLIYIVHHEYAVQVMLNTIDLILERNPDAVIIVQGDHGIHMQGMQDYLLELGYTVPQVLEMKHSVISAARIPTQYGGLDEPIEPLNMSRLLVNRFVGDNYEMLPDS